MSKEINEALKKLNVSKKNDGIPNPVSSLNELPDHLKEEVQKLSAVVFKTELQTQNKTQEQEVSKQKGNYNS
jgi:hypothetical protein